MSRPLRIQYEGAIYHVIARGNRRQTIFLDDADRMRWLGILADTCERFGFIVHAYCLMSNHFHLLLETPCGRLSAGMRLLNGVYSQAFNRKHELVGHLFQGRFGAFLCQRDAYFLELSRYIVLNPVRARLVSTPEQWHWSSYRLIMSNEVLPHWFLADDILAFFGPDRLKARLAYSEFVTALDAPASAPIARHGGLVLGDMRPRLREEFVQHHLESKEVVRCQKQALVPPLAQIFAEAANKNAAICAAFRTRVYSMTDIARFCQVSRRTIARVIAKAGLPHG